jgi:hemerythrin-like domain-containing protein
MGFSAPLEALEACHERIEEQLRTLEILAQQAPGAPPNREAASAARAVLRYFETSAAQHHQDEDDLFPLLRARAGELGRAEVAAAIDELEREHATLNAQWHRLRETLEAIAAMRKARLDAEEALRFAWLYRRHMDREALLVLPFAREALAAAERKELGARMAARRRTSPSGA